MAVVMIGGVIASTAVAALVLPALVAALPATARRREDLALQGT
jgi:Cu/Ag efflux pump CusA